VLFYGRVRALLELLSGRGDEVPLDFAALQLATIEYPGLEIDHFLGLIDSYAAELGDRLADPCDGPDFVMAANQYLFQELGFAGNASNYYDPRNSCLNEVLSARVGIPITLSVVYLEICRRLARPVRGIGLPGHFLVQYDDGQFAVYIDPFHGGALLTAEECFRLARTATGADVPPDPAFLAPVSKQQILLRMIRNLRAIYFSRRAYGKALQVLDLLLAACPESAGEYKQRSLVHQQLRNFRAARADLERYLELAPDSEDRADMEKQLRAIRQYLAGLN
jgi:regulator of sirC expression with transglutaminase-like and TPR domain